MLQLPVPNGRSARGVVAPISVASVLVLLVFLSAAVAGGQTGGPPMTAAGTLPIICSAPNVAIPDVGTVSDTISVIDSGGLNDLKIFLNVPHTWVGDLSFELEHVGGVSATIVDRPGVPATQFGCSGDDYEVVIDDLGLDGQAENQCDDSPAIHGDQVGGDPPGPVMSIFQGQDYSGDWVLSVTDSAGGDFGTLVEWCLLPNPPRPAVDVSPESLTIFLTSGARLTETLTISNPGDADLDWSIEEQALPASQAAMREPAHAASAIQEAVEQSGGSVGPVRAPGKVNTWVAPDSTLYDNGPFINGAGTGVGGANESILQTISLGMTGLGYSHAVTQSTRLADDFTIADPEGWSIGGLVFFAYQTGAGLPSTITGVNVQIWDGPPDDPASNIVFGDTTTNRMVATTWSNVFRVTEGSSGADVDRYILANAVEVATHLPPGTYWLDWQSDGSASSGPWSPPITIDGQATTGNGKHFFGGLWNLAIDPGTSTQQGLPFIILGEAGFPDCFLLSDIPWATVNPTSGMVDPGNNQPLSVIFDSAGLPDGTYLGNLCINTNDGANPLITVPLTMGVGEGRLYLPLVLKN